MRKTFYKIPLRIMLGLLYFIIFSSFVIINRSYEGEIPEKTDHKNPEFFANKKITDGPYVFYENDKIIVRWIKRGNLIRRTFSEKNLDLFKKNFGFEVDPGYFANNENISVDYKQVFNNIENVAVISDIHGQFDIFVTLLKQYEIIDDQYNWKYGKGHLVILGDILDRGDKVTELLWLTYLLEKQAEKAGGKVHYMIGNHELMVLNNDVRYIHDKYAATAKKMNLVYSQLFAENTFFGQWIKTKPAMVTINDILFVHAGVSTEFITNKITAEQTNKIFHEKIIGQSWDNILHDSICAFLMGGDGPVWNRGYFTTKIQEYQIDYLLKYFNVEHIIVGHTSMPNIISLYNNKIIGIDASIKEGDYGEMLIYKEKKFYRGNIYGNLFDLN